VTALRGGWFPESGDFAAVAPFRRRNGDSLAEKRGPWRAGQGEPAGPLGEAPGRH